MSEPQNMPGTVLSGRYQLDQLRVESAGSSTGVLQYDATDLSSLEAISVRIVALSQLIDTALGSTTADDALAAFEQQFDIASSLRHPCIESVLDHGEVTLDGERYVFVVGERLAGGSLREFLDRGRRLTPSQALIVGIDVCRALDAAAKQGISHSDLRPSRLVFGLDRRVRLVGFGAPLRPLDALGLEQATYSAPELAEGGARSASSDVYSLALILVESMTGEVPFAGETVAAAFANRSGKLLPVNADFGALAQVLEHAGRPTASERFSPREFGQALVQSAENLPRPTPIDVVGTGLFDAEVAVTDPSQPVVRPDISMMPPVENVAPNEPILIRTTPKFGGNEVADAPEALIITDGSAVTPLTIGGDDTGPIAMDAESLRLLASDDPTTQVVRSKKRWGRRITIGVAVIALIAGASGAAYFTVLNPKNPVPGLVGLTEAEARNQVSPFGWGITIVKERSDSVQAGQIIRTDPVLGVNLAKRDGITMVVSEGPTLSVLIELAGLTADEAKAKLAELGLEAAPIDTADETVAIGTVVSWTVPDQPTLKLGDSVVKGTTVAINVSTGPAMREVPNLLGMTLEAATAKLTELGLVVVVGPAMGSPDVPVGQISVQVPVAAEKLAKGGTVTITVSKGQVTTLIPTIYGKDLATVKERLLKYGMVIGKVTGNTKRGLKSALVDGKVVKNYARVIVGKTVDLVFPNLVSVGVVPILNEGVSMGALDGRVAIITGAGRGIGREHALLFAAEGAKVVVNDLGGANDGSGEDAAPAQQVVNEIKAMGGEAVANFDNVADWEGAQRMINAAVETFGDLDILVNNAGILRDRVLVNMTESEWDAVITVHLKGHFAPSRWAAAYWREQFKAGVTKQRHIVHTSSTSGLFSNPGQSNYGAAKTGIATFSQILAKELSRYNVKSNSIAPGARTRLTLATPGLGDRIGAPTDAAKFDEWDPANISPLVCYLSSEACEFTGETFYVAAGEVTRIKSWERAETVNQNDRWEVSKLTEALNAMAAEVKK